MKTPVRSKKPALASKKAKAAAHQKEVSEAYERAAQMNKAFRGMGRPVEPLPPLKDLPSPLFSTGDTVPVLLQETMRQASVTFLSISPMSAQWSYGLTTCDKGPVLNTVKDQSNWDARGRWAGGGPFASIQGELLKAAKAGRAKPADEGPSL